MTNKLKWDTTELENQFAPCLASLKGPQVERPFSSLAEYVFMYFDIHSHRNAVSDGVRQLTYRELKWQVDRLSDELGTMDLSENAVVGIIANRSIELVIGILAVIKIGRTYMPIDESTPPARLNHIISDSKVDLILAASRARDAEPTLKAIKIIPLSLTEPDSAIRPSLSDVTKVASPYKFPPPAYLIYTSGTTGKPKGVEISQRALTNFLMSMQELLHIDYTDRMFFLSSISFDISLLEILFPLCNGAGLFIANNAGYEDSDALAEQISKNDISIVQATPSGWQLLLASGIKVPDRAKLICGGEPLTTSLANRLLSLGGQLWNMYGPTETTIWTSAKCIVDTSDISIGQPITNTCLYILGVEWEGNEKLDVLHGELCIAGVGLADQYRNLNNMTLEKFIYRTESNGERLRLYRTGDIVRISSNGEICFVCRRDRQVKVRGFRLEPEEIENAILKDPLVEQCCVVPQAKEGVYSHVIAYIALSNRHNLPVSEIQNVMTFRIKSSLSGVLPSYMLPQEYLFVDSLPINCTGKIDYNKLKDMNQLVHSADSGIPRTDTEKTLSVLWLDLLRVEVVGVGDSFSSLGGNSLIAAKLSQRIDRHFGLKFSIGQILKNDVFRDMCSAIDQRLKTRE